MPLNGGCRLMVQNTDGTAYNGTGWGPTIDQIAGVQPPPPPPSSMPWADVTGKPSFGTASLANAGDFATAAQGVKADTALQNAALFATAAQGMKADSARLTNARNPAFVAGQGGTVTQLTSKSTGVTLNTLCGAITMHNAALAAAAEVSFVVTNSTVAITDVPVVAIRSVGTVGSYMLCVSAVAAGSFTVSIGNVSAGSLSQALVLNFIITKSVAA